MTPKQHRHRILIADDNPVNRKLIQRILALMKHHTESAANGYEVLRRLEKARFDFVLMDVHMPELDGIETTKRIVDAFKTQIRPVIIAMTANAAISDRNKCLEAGMDDYISKPILIQELEHKLEHWGQRLGPMTGHAQETEPLPAPEPRANPLISEDRLKELQQLMPDPHALQDLFRWFLTRNQKLFTKLKNDVLDGKVSEAMVTVHSLKGAYLNYGALQLADRMEELEDRLTREDFEHIHVIMNQVEESTKLTKQAIELWIRSYSE
jgi:CheY-like chemotaxis protein